MTDSFSPSLPEAHLLAQRLDGLHLRRAWLPDYLPRLKRSWTVICFARYPGLMDIHGKCSVLFRAGNLILRLITTGSEPAPLFPHGRIDLRRGSDGHGSRLENVRRCPRRACWSCRCSTGFLLTGTTPCPFLLFQRLDQDPERRRRINRMLRELNRGPVGAAALGFSLGRRLKPPGPPRSEP